MLRGLGGRPHGKPPTPTPTPKSTPKDCKSRLICGLVDAVGAVNNVDNVVGVDVAIIDMFIGGSILSAGSTRCMACATSRAVYCCPDGRGPDCSGLCVAVSVE